MPTWLRPYDENLKKLAMYEMPHDKSKNIFMTKQQPKVPLTYDFMIYL